MRDQTIEDFARLLVKHVRDAAIQNCDSLLTGKVKSVTGQRWTKALHGEASRELAALLIADCVDETIFCLLDAIDQGLIPLSFAAAQGEPVDLNAEGEGELGGHFLRDEGWRAEFSQERFSEY